MSEREHAPQRTTGIFAILSSARMYDFVQDSLGARHFRERFVADYIAPVAKPDAKVLDVGCGTGAILEYLKGTRYLGLDLSERYVESARKRYGSVGRFLCANVSDVAVTDHEGPFDVILMTGLLHHLSDAEVEGLFAAVARTLAPGGCVLTIDPTFAWDSHPFARFLAARDRGRHVRRPPAYGRLAEKAFADVTVHVRHDLLRVPYSHAILSLRAPREKAERAA